MKNNFIDEIVRKSLEGMDVPYDAASWQSLEQRIAKDADLSSTNDNSAEDAFDAIIKTALTADVVSTIPMNWEALEGRMNLDADFVPDIVDQSYKTALENIEVPYTPAAWDLMESQLDLEDSMADLEADDVVDQVVYNNINNLQSPYDSNSWQTLSDKLDGTGVLRQRIVYRYKAAELLLFLLLLTTVYNFLPLSKSTISLDTPIAHQESSTNTKTLTNTTSHSELVPSEITPLFAEVTSVNSKKGTKQAEKLNDASVLLDNKQKSNQIIAQNPVSTERKSSLFVPNVKNDRQQTIQNATLASKSFPLVSDKKETSSSLRYRLLTEDQRLEMGLAFLPIIPSNVVDFAVEKPIYNCITCTAPKTMRIYASMFLMGDFNYILTPYDRTFQVDAYSNSSAGYGLGSTVAFSYGNWELETGAMYATKIYQPETLTETIGDFEAGYVDLSLKQIELNILQIPLHVRYNFDKSNNWNVYASTGASLQVAVFKNSDFDSNYTARPSLEESTSRQSLQEIINENSTFNEQRFSNGGWFEEGGTFIENRYFTANISLGIERSLGARWSVFTQTMYQHTLTSNGFGPKNDRINTVSILVGARTQFGSKLNSTK